MVETYMKSSFLNLDQMVQRLCEFQNCLFSRSHCNRISRFSISRCVSSIYTGFSTKCYLFITYYTIQENLLLLSRQTAEQPSGGTLTDWLISDSIEINIKILIEFYLTCTYCIFILQSSSTVMNTTKLYHL